MEDSKRKPKNNSRVQSFSPVAKGKDSFGLYYDQQPESAEARIKTKQMTYFSKKNLKDYKLNDSARDNKLKYSVPMYSSNAIQLSSSGSKGMLTTSNFSNNDKKEVSTKKKSQLLKWSTSQIKYKSKKNNDSSGKSSHSKYSASYSTKRPKSAKGTGLNSKHEYLYKYSMHKGNSSSKFSSSSKKRNDTSSQLRKTQPIKDITTKSK